VTTDAAGTIYPWRYTGQRLNEWTGLYHYKARAYSPTYGRFLQPDPIGYKDGPNIYEYVGDDPFDRSDPTGLAGCNGPDKKTCKDAQTRALVDVKSAQAAFSAFRANPNSARGQAYSKAFDRAFGKGASKDGRQRARYQAVLNYATAWLNDPGKAAGGKYDFYNGDAGGRLGTIWDNKTVLDTNLFYKGSGRDQERTVIHEPLHWLTSSFFRMGGDHSVGMDGYYGAKALAEKSPSVAQKNPDSYTYFIMGDFFWAI
jgi:RHS repeat-associated protein